MTPRGTNGAYYSPLHPPKRICNGAAVRRSTGHRTGKFGHFQFVLMWDTSKKHTKIPVESTEELKSKKSD